MSQRAWQDMIVGDRMEVDQEFTKRVQQSQFSRQQWGLIMTAVELKIEGAGEDARLVADTSQVEEILPELDKLESQMGAMGGGGGSGGGSGSFLGSIMSSLGLSGGSGANEQTHRAATQLAEEYATTLQAHLEENGKWQLVRD